MAEVPRVGGDPGTVRELAAAPCLASEPRAWWVEQRGPAEMPDRDPPTRRHGDFTLHAIGDGLFRLDGGAMFGTVPKVLWDGAKPADALNRIDLCASCLLARRGAEVLLFEAGLGRKASDKARRIYGMDLRVSIDDELGRLGLGPEDVDHVLLTHLHFDHAGSLTLRRPDGSLVPHFPRARHHVHALEWAAAQSPNARSRASYLAEDWLTVREAGLFDLFEGGDPVEVLAGVAAELTPGHTPGHVVYRLDGGADGAAVFLGDLVPTGAHVPVPWIMGYDLDPVRQVGLKAERLPAWAEEGALLVFAHETRYPWARLARDGRGALAAEGLDEGWLEPFRSVPWPEELPQGAGA